MLKLKVLLIVLCGLISISGYSMTSEDFLTDKTANLRNTSAGSAQLIAKMTNDLLTSTNSYDICWQLAAIYYFHGDYYVKNKDQKKFYFTQAKDYGLKAVALNPDGVDGHYWLAIAYAKWSEANGILDSLFYAEDVLKELTAAIKIKPAFLWGLAYAVRAKVYFLAPGWPLSIGNKEYAYRDIQKAMSIGPNYRVNLQFYAEMLRDDGKWNEALVLMEKALVLPFDERIPKEEERSIREIKQEIEQVRERAGASSASLGPQPVF